MTMLPPFAAALRRRFLLPLALVATTASACSSPGSTSSDEAPTSDESSGASAGGESNTTVQQALVATDSVFNFDPTVDPAATPPANAQSIGAYVSQNLSGCGSVQVSGASVAVSFGAAPGCTLQNVVVVSGSVNVAVSQSGSTTTLAVTFASLVVNGKSLGGSVSLATSNGTTYATTLTLTTGDGSFNGAVTVTGTKGSFVVDGNVQSVQNGTSGSEVFTAVAYTLGECYPDGGSIQVTRGAIRETLSFSSTTPSTGTVTVTAGKKSYPYSLPSYGNCPAADGGASVRPSSEGGLRDR